MIRFCQSHKKRWKHFWWLSNTYTHRFVYLCMGFVHSEFKELSLSLSLDVYFWIEKANVFPISLDSLSLFEPLNESSRPKKTVHNVEEKQHSTPNYPAFVHAFCGSSSSLLLSLFFFHFSCTPHSFHWCNATNTQIPGHIHWTRSVSSLVPMFIFIVILSENCSTCTCIFHHRS